MCSPAQSLQVSIPAPKSELSPYLQTILDKKVNKEALSCFECIVHWFLTTFCCFNPAYKRLYNEAEVINLPSPSMPPLEDVIAVPESTRNDNSPEFWRGAVEENPLCIEEAEPPIRDNKEIMGIAARKNIQALRFANALRGDENFMLEMIATHADAFALANENLKRQYHFVLDAVTANPLVFPQIKETFKTNSQFLVDVIVQHQSVQPLLTQGAVLEESVILEAIERASQVFLTLSDDLRNNEDFRMSAIGKNRRVFGFFSELHDHTDFVHKAATHNGLILQLAPAFNDNYIIVHAAVSENGKALEFASDRLRDDLGIAEAAIKQAHSAQDYISTRLQQHPHLATVYAESWARFLAQK